ncbi:hypothetical protein K1719_030311 [Acacia pycnantha]|nr:hypothetical protein K1719_030311 [Acacia pycnantha]
MKVKIFLLFWVEGKPSKLNFTAEEYTNWCLPWMNSLIIKVLGASFPTYVIRDRINRMWHPNDALKLIPLSNGYYILSFSNKEDREYAFQEGPWMIEDHYLIVQRWRPNFSPWKADLQCIIAAWVRLPDVPFEFYNVESLRRVGNMIGKMIKVDRWNLNFRGASLQAEEWRQQFVLLCWWLWRRRNTFVFEGKRTSNFSIMSSVNVTQCCLKGAVDRYLALKLSSAVLIVYNVTSLHFSFGLMFGMLAFPVFYKD